MDIRFPESHPIWSILRTVILILGLTGLLYLNANNFDATELTTIIEMIVLAGGFEAAKKVLAKKDSGG
ncbi:MAG: hypothetical protein Unbinned1606contig1000_5 [Prokaryotic dsDNA virus sp.]|nr:MAG: hypothetical protein Unbinned1606contig1000_5 [Prokaryotic dsDNA virus sp.]|tara:strand:+ start:401 stop:604 length:204 start_codon:yes stop_codon:yes gene_type:complete